MHETLLLMSATEIREWYASVPGDVADAVCEELASLPGGRARRALTLLNACRRRHLAEMARLTTMYRYEAEARKEGGEAIAGVDEVGRGPLAGPVMAAAVILRPGDLIPGLNDSKQVAPAERERLYHVIVSRALAYSVALKDVGYIDRYNIAKASFAAMRDALSSLSIRPDFVLVDGFRIPGIELRQRAIVKGDALSNSIAAASIIAKVTRDRLMQDLHRRYPQYGFSENKGYSTKDHQAALLTYGPCPEHRRSFTRVMAAQLLLDDTEHS
jgi:ribonuclease HII